MVEERLRRFGVTSAQAKGNFDATAGVYHCGPRVAPFGSDYGI